MPCAGTGSRLGARGALIALGLSVATLAASPSPTARAQDDAAATAGASLFLQRCAECHGADGKGVAGHDLMRLWSAGATDSQVFQTIRSGVPNTIMPSSSAPDAELWTIVGYLRRAAGTPAAEAVSGNLENGERLFRDSCDRCHRVNGRGGRLGPDLSRINQSREQLIRAIRTPSAALAQGFEPLTLVLRDGRRVRALRKSEDAFSVQVMDVDERLQGYLKSDLRDIVRETMSLMPVFGTERLNDRDLDDVLRFLSTLRPATRPGAGARSP